MKNTLTYQEQLQQALGRASRKRNVEAIVYYQTRDWVHGVACVSFETFKNSFAYELWKNLPETKDRIELEKNKLSRRL